MTERKKFKQLIRERMARTGESYTQAKKGLEEESQEPGPAKARGSAKGGVYTCLDCGHRGERLTIRSRCPMCGVKATWSNTV